MLLSANREAVVALKFCVVLVLLLMISACGSMDPRKVDVELEQTAPQVQVTSYTQALSDLGLMSEIYNTGPLKVQSDDIADNTGLSVDTQGEIQRNITEMIKSTLNSMGGNIIFIEYNPAYIQNQIVTGYSKFDQKLIPDVVVTGGITEFDRALETRGEGTDAGVDAKATGLPGWVPSDTIGIDYSDSGKKSKARITLDFNLKDFQTLAGIAKMNTINSIEVHKATREKEIGITLFGPSFGLEGSVKKVQGRHAAVRLLVQLSMIQMMGRYLTLPYWNLLGDAATDAVVMSNLERMYYSMSEAERVAKMQEYLFLHGYDVGVSGRLDTATLAALEQHKPGSAAQGGSIGKAQFIELYLSLPVSEKVRSRRAMLSGAGSAQAFTRKAAPPAPTSQQSAGSRSNSSQNAPAAVQQEKEQKPAHVTKGGGGKILNDKDW